MVKIGLWALLIAMPSVIIAASKEECRKNTNVRIQALDGEFLYSDPTVSSNHVWFEMTYGPDTINTMFTWELEEKFANKIIDDTRIISRKNDVNKVDELFKSFENEEMPKLFRPKFIFFTGPSGSGKSTLARAIAVALRRPYKFINCEALFTKYRSDASANLTQHVAPIINSGKPFVIILDEFNRLYDYFNSKEDPDKGTITRMWTLIDTANIKGDVLFVGTANGLDSVPEQFLERTLEQHMYLPLPDEKKRELLITQLFDEHLPLKYWTDQINIDITQEQCQTNKENFIKWMKYETAGSSLHNLKLVMHNIIAQSFNTKIMPSKDAVKRSLIRYNHTKRSYYIKNFLDNKYTQHLMPSVVQIITSAVALIAGYYTAKIFYIAQKADTERITAEQKVFQEKMARDQQNTQIRIANQQYKNQNEMYNHSLTGMIKLYIKPQELIPEIPEPQVKNDTLNNN